MNIKIFITVVVFYSLSSNADVAICTAQQMDICKNCPSSAPYCCVSGIAKRGCDKDSNTWSNTGACQVQCKIPGENKAISKITPVKPVEVIPIKKDEPKPVTIADSSRPKDPPYWIVDGGDKFKDMLSANFNSSRGGGLFSGGPMGKCSNKSEIYKDGKYLRLSAENGCSARSTFDDPAYHFNPPASENDKPLEIEIWTMMQLPAGKDAKWGKENVWASVWFEGNGAWPESGEFDAIEWCCPGAPEANFHNKTTGSYPNVAGWTQYNNNWPKDYYNKLIHVYTVWEYNRITVYAGTENDTKDQMKKVASMENWRTKDGTFWYRGWPVVMDVKRYENLGQQKGFNLWAAIRTRGGGNSDPGRINK
jgi:hypothetical protein